jgi:hypothetical protein
VCSARPGRTWPLRNARPSASKAMTDRLGLIRKRIADSNYPSMGFGDPTTLTETGSDLHRACLTQLCCASRLSQPLDALFRPQPLRPCFMPVTPLGFGFQRFSLPGSGPTSRWTCPPCRFWWPTSSPARCGVSSTYDFEDSRIRGVRTRQAGVTRYLRADPLLAFTSPRCSPL